MSSDEHNNRPLIDAAHDYAQRGWRVIQLHSVGPDGETCSCNRGRNCLSKGKHPVNKAWQNSPPLSGSDIHELWTARPNANVGIATGDQSGFWVLDIDPEHGGFVSMSELIGTYGQLPQTRVTRTGSGGYHYWFAMPGFPVNNSSKRLPAGIDVRGTGGQIVAPPSHTNKGDYAVVRDVDPIPAPDWLLDLVRPKEAPAITAADFDTTTWDSLSEAEQGRLHTYTTKAVQALVRQLSAASPGERNNTTFEVACSLLELANSPWNPFDSGQALAILRGESPTDADFADDEVMRCFDSAKEHIGDRARPLPLDRSLASTTFMDGADVRSDAPATSDDEAPPAEPSGGLFDKSRLNTEQAGRAVLAYGGPIAWGRDSGFWSYQEGVWRSDRKVVVYRLTRLLRDRYTTTHRKNVEEWLTTNTEELQGLPHENYINFKNGMLDWKAEPEPKLIPHDPIYYSTVQMGCDWDPHATCPTFDAWLTDILHPDYIALCWEMIGYLMCCGNKMQVAFMLYGRGQNGKGTLLSVIEALLSSDSIAAKSLNALNSDKFAAIDLFAKTANIAGDIDATFQESTANFKKLTGTDTYAAERKYGDSFNFVSWAVPMFSANDIPGSADTSEGYLRRWVLLHFQKHIDKSQRDLSIAERLKAEIPGIAARAVPALRTLWARGYFEPAGEAAKGSELIADKIDQVRRWVKVAERAPEHFAPADRLYHTYTAWAERTHTGTLSSEAFFHRLEAIGFERVNQSGVDGYVGLLDSHTSSRMARADSASFMEGVN